MQRLHVLRAPSAGLVPLAASLLMFFSLGCSPKTPVDRGASAYEGGDYESAVSRLEGAELSYADGTLGPEYELKYLAYVGLSHHRLWKESGNKRERRLARPFVRRALDRWSKIPEAKAAGWLDPQIVADLEAAAKDGAQAVPDAEASDHR